VHQVPALPLFALQRRHEVLELPAQQSDQLLLALQDGVQPRGVSVFTLDIKNAFKSKYRGLILKGVWEYCPEIEPWIRRFYGGQRFNRARVNRALARAILCPCSY
jgi:hypothetical protein